MPVDPLYVNPWSAYVKKGEGEGPLGTMLTGHFYKLHSSGELLELAEKWDAPVPAFLKDTHEQLMWDTSYLEE